jgi:hypothetical protein
LIIKAPQLLKLFTTEPQSTQRKTEIKGGRKAVQSAGCRVKRGKAMKKITPKF